MYFPLKSLQGLDFLKFYLRLKLPYFSGKVYIYLGYSYFPYAVTSQVGSLVKIQPNQEVTWRDTVIHIS